MESRWHPHALHGSAASWKPDATKIWIKGTFAVQLHDLDADNCQIGNFALNLDPGQTTGVAVTRESPDGKHRTIVGAYDRQHRNREIHHGLDQRRDCRRNRRDRLRRRPTRFNNRKKPDGWLPPSLQSIVDDFQVITRTMRRLYPINHIRIEYLKFDTQLMQNPDIRGVEYQQGALQGWQLRHYILHRDNWTCQYCDRPAGKSRTPTLEHVIPESKGGPSRVYNLVAACQQCNTKKGNQPIEAFLAHDPERLARIQEQANRMVPLTAAGHLNSVMPQILTMLEATGLPVTVCDGASTAYARQPLGIEKSHVNDAPCLDLPERVDNLTARITQLKRHSRRQRQSINCDKHGSPASKDFPDYCRLPRSQQGYTAPPAHSVGPRRLRGIRSGDLVRIRHHSGQDYTGRCTLAFQDRRVKLKAQGPQGRTVTATPEKTILIAHQSRWTATTRR